MSNVLFVDIPTVDEHLSGEVKRMLTLRNMVQDCINALYGVPKSYQRHKKQFSRGLLTIATHIEKHGHKAKYFSYRDIKNEIFKDLVKESDFICVPGNFTAFFNITKKICPYVKEIDRNAVVVTGGYHTTAADIESLKECKDIDIVVRGEGEQTLLEVIEGNDLSKIKGISYRNNKQIIRNDNRPLLNPSDIPNPAYHILPSSLRDYNYNVQTTRGCPYRCVFCPNGFFWERVRFQPVDKVMEELKLLDSALEKNTVIHFTDNIFTLNRKRTIELCNRIREENIKLLFSCDLKANYIDKELIKIMEDSNFVRVSFGFEDADENVLGNMNKQVTFEQYVKSAKIVKENSNIAVEAYWLLGLPGSNHSSMKKNIKAVRYLLRNNIIDLISRSSSVLVPHPGIPIYDNPNSFGIKIYTKNWDKYLRNEFFPSYRVKNLSRRELFYYFILFEKTILNEYCRKLGIRVDELEKFHKNIMSEDFKMKISKEIELKIGRY